ncbi:PREDICTED: pentatricopeptide repeat-containing protein At1g06140, mitochondrial [Nelumbo nucifera]|nr:PREDICTED: pentatricopeptide repeat-containing protein At1g06140, mitochondrial [Nelumbo nucifera]
MSNVYIEVGFLENASQTFEQISSKNPHSWNTIISGYFKDGRFSDVLHLCKRMWGERHTADSFNLVFAVKASVGLCNLRMGQSVHSHAIKSALEGDSYVSPSLMTMYVELGSLEEAQKIFDRVSERNDVSCGCMIRGYLNFSKEYEVFELYHEMVSAGYELDSFSVEGLIRACGNVCAGREGNALHGYCIKRCFMDSGICLQTCIVDMYTKCGLLECALKLFEEISDKDVVLWSSMIAGFSKNGRTWQAISLFHQMLEESIVPNAVTFSSVLPACSHLGSLQLGKAIHGYVTRTDFELDVVSYTAFIDIYAKCGHVWIAYRMFNKMPERNVYSWSAMINGFGIHGLYSEAFNLFAQMMSENLEPNSITFVSVLSACSHSGRIEEGWRYFHSMSRDHGISPAEEHYACMVDLLARAGQIDEALNFVNNMPIHPGASIWGALLGACRIHKKVELAEQVAKKLLVLEPDQSGMYVLLSNIYAAVGMWRMVKKMRGMMSEKGLNKIVGFSLIEVGKKIYVFNANDRCVDRNMEIENVWSSLQEQMKAHGYLPHISLAHDMDD